MQMRKMYESTNRKVRSARLRADAQECAAAGFTTFADVNAEEASWVDPAPRIHTERN